MGKAYAPALVQIPMWYRPPAAMPKRTLVVDIDEKSAKENAARYGYNRWGVGWKAAVEDPEVDVVLVLVPNNLHKEIVLAAAEAGKHICCEKPLAMDAKEAKEMLDAAEKAGIKHQTAFNWRFNPAVQMAKKMVAEGALGRLYDFRGWWLADWPMDPDIPLSWRFQKALAGTGSIGDIGSHVIDLARFLVGEVTEVCGVADTYIKERAIVSPFAPPAGSVKDKNARKGPVDVDDNAAFIMRFENGEYRLHRSDPLQRRPKELLWLRVARTEGHALFRLAAHERAAVPTTARIRSIAKVSARSSPGRCTPTARLSGRCRATGLVTPRRRFSSSTTSSRRSPTIATLRRISMTAGGLFRWLTRSCVPSRNMHGRGSTNPSSSGPRLCLIRR